MPPRRASVPGVQIDVFTLFPHWFDWFRTQRHVTNAAALGHTLETVDYRAETPLKGGRVDDVPFGGGAGMVLRVDVVEAALRARYHADPVELREQRRVIALTPGGRCSTTPSPTRSRGRRTSLCCAAATRASTNA